MQVYEYVAYGSIDYDRVKRVLNFIGHHIIVYNVYAGSARGYLCLLSRQEFRFVFRFSFFICKRTQTLLLSVGTVPVF